MARAVTVYPMIHNIVTEFEEGVKPTRECLALFHRCLQECLRPYSEKINQQNGTVVMIFAKNGSSRFRLENIEKPLKEQIAEQFPDLFPF
jgi:hypothetical protein